MGECIMTPEEKATLKKMWAWVAVTWTGSALSMYGMHRVKKTLSNHYEL